MDSGAGKGLIGENDVRELNAQVEPSESQFVLITANGEVPSNSQALINVPGINHTLKPPNLT